MEERLESERIDSIVRLAAGVLTNWEIRLIR